MQNNLQGRKMLFGNIQAEAFIFLNNISRLRKLFCNIHDDKNFISTYNFDCQLIGLSTCIKRGSR